MRLADLVQDAVTGQLSGSKIWGHIGNLITSVAVVFYILHRNLDFQWVLIYLGVVSSGQVASKFVSARMGLPATPPEQVTQP